MNIPMLCYDSYICPMYLEGSAFIPFVFHMVCILSAHSVEWQYVLELELSHKVWWNVPVLAWHINVIWAFTMGRGIRAMPSSCFQGCINIPLCGGQMERDQSDAQPVFVRDSLVIFLISYLLKGITGISAIRDGNSKDAWKRKSVLKRVAQVDIIFNKP